MVTRRNITFGLGELSMSGAQEHPLTLSSGSAT